MCRRGNPVGNPGTGKVLCDGPKGCEKSNFRTGPRRPRMGHSPWSGPVFGPRISRRPFRAGSHFRPACVARGSSNRAWFQARIHRSMPCSTHNESMPRETPLQRHEIGSRTHNPPVGGSSPPRPTPGLPWSDGLRRARRRSHPPTGTHRVRAEDDAPTSEARVAGPTARGAHQPCARTGGRVRVRLLPRVLVHATRPQPASVRVSTAVSPGVRLSSPHAHQRVRSAAPPSIGCDPRRESERRK